MHGSLDVSYFQASVVSGFTLYLVWYLTTYSPTLIASVYRLSTVWCRHIFWHPLLVRRLICLPLSLTLSQGASDFFTSIIKKRQQKHCTPSFALHLPPGSSIVLELIAPYTFIHTVLIPFLIAPFWFAPLVHTTRFVPRPFFAAYVVHFLSK